MIKFLCFLLLCWGTDLFMPDQIYGQTHNNNGASVMEYQKPRTDPTIGPVYEWNGLFMDEWPEDSSIIIIPFRAGGVSTQSQTVQTTGTEDDLDDLLTGVISYTNQTITHQFYASIGIIKLCVIDEYGFIHIGKYVDTGVVTSDLIDISILPERQFSIYCMLPDGEKYFYNFTIEE